MPEPKEMIRRWTDCFTGPKQIRFPPEPLNSFSLQKSRQSSMTVLPPLVVVMPPPER